MEPFKARCINANGHLFHGRICTITNILYECDGDQALYVVEGVVGSHFAYRFEKIEEVKYEGFPIIIARTNSKHAAECLEKALKLQYGDRFVIVIQDEIVFHLAKPNRELEVMARAYSLGYLNALP